MLMAPAAEELWKNIQTSKFVKFKSMSFFRPSTADWSDEKKFVEPKASRNKLFKMKSQLHPRHFPKVNNFLSTIEAQEIRIKSARKEGKTPSDIMWKKFNICPETPSIKLHRTSNVGKGKKFNSQNYVYSPFCAFKASPRIQRMKYSRNVWEIKFFTFSSSAKASKPILLPRFLFWIPHEKKILNIPVEFASSFSLRTPWAGHWSRKIFLG